MSKTFVHEFLLKTFACIKTLEIRFEMARFLYNAVIREALKRASLIKQSTQWQKAKNRKVTNRTKLFKEARELYNFSDYSLQKFAIVLKNQ